MWIISSTAQPRNRHCYKPLGAVGHHQHNKSQRSPTPAGDRDLAVGCINNMLWFSRWNQTIRQGFAWKTCSLVPAALGRQRVCCGWEGASKDGRIPACLCHWASPTLGQLRSAPTLLGYGTGAWELCPGDFCYVPHRLKVLVQLQVRQPLEASPVLHLPYPQHSCQYQEQQLFFFFFQKRERLTKTFHALNVTVSYLMHVNSPLFPYLIF